MIQHKISSMQHTDTQALACRLCLIKHNPYVTVCLKYVGLLRIVNISLIIDKDAADKLAYELVLDCFKTLLK